MPGGKNPRRKGTSFELRVKKHLESLGYFAVRQPRSAFPDLLVVHNLQVLFIECKCCKYITKTEREDLLQLVAKHGGRCLIAYKKDDNIGFCDVNYEPTTIGVLEHENRDEEIQG